MLVAVFEHASITLLCTLGDQFHDACHSWCLKDAAMLSLSMLRSHYYAGWVITFTKVGQMHVKVGVSRDAAMMVLDLVVRCWLLSLSMLSLHYYAGWAIISQM